MISVSWLYPVWLCSSNLQKTGKQPTSQSLGSPDPPALGSSTQAAWVRLSLNSLEKNRVSEPRDWFQHEPCTVGSSPQVGKGHYEFWVSFKSLDTPASSQPGNLLHYALETSSQPVRTLRFLRHESSPSLQDPSAFWDASLKSGPLKPPLWLI